MMNIRYFSQRTTELSRDEAISEIKSGGYITVAYRARWEDHRAKYVEVYGPYEQSRQVTGPEVNWAGIGSVSPGEATAYAALITEAAKIAGEAI
jgi:hypothetical protein